MVLVSILGCSKAEINKYQNTQPLLGTRVSITVFSEDAQKANRAIKSAFQKIAQLETLLSKHKKDSDIARLNQVQMKQIKVSPITFEVIKKAIEFGQISNGAFDITVEPFIKLWQEGQKYNALPSSDGLAKLKQRTGYTDITLKPESLEIGFNKRDMSIDLGGIAKGYIIDEAVKVLKSQGITQALIDAGGDMYALGSNPKSVRSAQDKPGQWLVGIRNPLKPEEILKNIKISNKAVATSGHYMRFYTIQGKKYSHIIDPRTGRSVKENIASVTVIAPDATTADALATAISVLGSKEGLKLVESLPEVETLIITRKGEELSFIKSAGFSPE